MDYNSSNWDHCLDFAVLSDVGMRRANNQDSMAVTLAADQAMFDSRGHLFLVADGMGAHVAGEMASKLAADNVPLSYHKYADLPAPEALRRAVHDANDIIHRRGESSEDFKGMGTTCSTLALTPPGAILAHVGDSRVYRLRGSVLDQLTFDHSLVWEMRASGQIPADQIETYIPKNIITRSLGPNPDVSVDLEGPFPLEPGDTFLLCSDGLSGQLSEKEMGAVLGCLPPKKAVRALVDLANLRGGPDNITVIVARVIGPQTAKTASAAASAKPKPEPQAGPVHPLIWTMLGTFALAALIMVLVQQGIAALVCAGLSLLAGVIALIQHSMQPHGPARPQGAALGRGPYTRCDCTPDDEVVAGLADVASELRQAATEGEYKVEWTTFNGWIDRAQAHRKAGKMPHAVHDFAEAICFMMAQLRTQGRRPPNNK
jgi:protein phosphatase